MHTYPGVEAASDTTIEITFQYKRVRCRERLKMAPTPANMKRAFQQLATIKDAINRGVFNYAETFPDSPRARRFNQKPAKKIPTIGEYLHTWLEERKKKLKASTWNDYRKIVKTLTEALGDVSVPELKRPIIKAWISKRPGSNKRLANIQSVLRAALDEAVSDDIIEHNPMANWAYKNADAVKEEDDVDPFTIEEEAAILAAIREPQSRHLFKFCFWSGMRTSEVVALRWGDIDWLRGTAHVRRALTQAAGAAETPKTKSSKREVKLLAPALEALMQQKPYTFLLNAEIFHNPRTNAPWTGDQPIRHGVWVPALQRSGVRYRRPYQTRHTYASRMLTAGESPMWVAEQMGHNDWGMIRRVYGKFIPDMIPNAGNSAVAMFTERKIG